MHDTYSQNTIVFSMSSKMGIQLHWVKIHVSALCRAIIRLSLNLSSNYTNAGDNLMMAII